MKRAMSAHQLYREQESSPHTRRRWRWGVVSDLGGGLERRSAIGRRQDAVQRRDELRQAEHNVAMFYADEKVHAEARERAYLHEWSGV